MFDSILISLFQCLRNLKLYNLTILPTKEYQDMVILTGDTSTEDHQSQKENNVEVFRIDNEGMVRIKCSIPKFPIKPEGSRGVATQNGILVCGGIIFNLPSSENIKDCYQLKPRMASWTTFPSMPESAWNFGLVKMRDGVFALGGQLGQFLYYDGKWMTIAKGGSYVSYSYGCFAKIDENRIMHIGGGVRMGEGIK